MLGVSGTSSSRDGGLPRADAKEQVLKIEGEEELEEVAVNLFFPRLERDRRAVVADSTKPPPGVELDSSSEGEELEVGG